MNPPEEPAQLRSGFSTGACAAAAAKAAYLSLKGKDIDPESPLEIMFPDGVERELIIKEATADSNSGTATIIKDAGDDPDVTDKSEIKVSIRKSSPEELTDADYFHSCGRLGKLIIRGGSGVGLSTRDGLDVPKGKWAINPVPQKMLCENLLIAGFNPAKAEYLLVEISVADGENIAKRTLNPTLGIEGGISILGTTGIVKPYSNEAYIHTLKLLIKNAKESGANEIVLTTGSSTSKAVREELHDIPEERFIRIGDFIADALKYADTMDFDCVHIACMPGKLFKYACGHEYTHAHFNPLCPKDLKPFMQLLDAPPKYLAMTERVATVREIFEKIPESLFLALMNLLADKGTEYFRTWAPETKILDLNVFDSKGFLVTKRCRIRKA